MTPELQAEFSSQIKSIILRYVLLAINDYRRDVEAGVHPQTAKRAAIEQVSRSIDEGAGLEVEGVDWN